LQLYRADLINIHGDDFPTNRSQGHCQISTQDDTIIKTYRQGQRISKRDFIFMEFWRELIAHSIPRDKTDEKLRRDTLKQLRPIGKGDQELEKRLDQKELT
jgi:hypothetical protein